MISINYYNSTSSLEKGKAKLAAIKIIQFNIYEFLIELGLWGKERNYPVR